MPFAHLTSLPVVLPLAAPMILPMSGSPERFPWAVPTGSLPHFLGSASPVQFPAVRLPWFPLVFYAGRLRREMSLWRLVLMCLVMNRRGWVEQPSLLQTSLSPRMLRLLSDSIINQRGIMGDYLGGWAPCLPLLVSCNKNPLSQSSPPSHSFLWRQLLEKLMAKFSRWSLIEHRMLLLSWKIISGFGRSVMLFSVIVVPELYPRVMQIQYWSCRDLFMYWGNHNKAFFFQDKQNQQGKNDPLKQFYWEADAVIFVILFQRESIWETAGVLLVMEDQYGVLMMTCLTIIFPIVSALGHKNYHFPWSIHHGGLASTFSFSSIMVVTGAPHIY